VKKRNASTTGDCYALTIEIHKSFGTFRHVYYYPLGIHFNQENLLIFQIENYFKADTQLLCVCVTTAHVNGGKSTIQITLANHIVLQFTANQLECLSIFSRKSHVTLTFIDLQGLCYVDKIADL